MVRVVCTTSALLVVACLLLTLVRSASAEDAPPPKPVLLKPVALEDPLDIPPGARHPIGPGLVPAWFGEGIRVEAHRKGLRLVDTAKRFSPTVVLPEKPRLFKLDRKDKSRQALVFHDGTRWWAGVGAAYTAKLARGQIWFLDANLDGALEPGTDFVRWGAGVMRPITKHRLIPLGARRVQFTVSAADEALRVAFDFQAVSKPPPSAAQAACLASCNDVRNRLYGLPPLAFDAARSIGCQKHATYLYLNGYDFTAAWDGIGSHGEREGAKGYSKEGLQAGMASTISSRPEGDVMARDQARTMIHRVQWLGTVDEGLGVGMESRSKSEDIRGYCVVWGPRLPAIPKSHPAILVPAPGARQVPRRVKAENPAPNKPVDAYATARGMPVSVTFGRMALKGERVQLFRGVHTRVAVEGVLYTRAKPVHSSRPDNMMSVFFLPTDPLAAKQRYTAVFTATRAEEDGGTLRYEWFFETGK